MKISCQKVDLQKAIAAADRITGKNLSLPVLKGIKIEVKNDELIVSATNLDLGIRVRVKAKIVGQGSFVVPGAVLGGFLANINDGRIDLEVSGERLKIKTKTHQTTISLLAKDEFPRIPEVKGEKKFTIDSKKIIDGLKFVWFCASNSTMKPELSSVFIKSETDKLFFVATDSFRLAEKKVSVENDFEIESILIPARNIPEIIRILENVGEQVSVNVENNQISFSQGEYYLVSRVVDGNFPDYDQIIPKEFKTNIICLKEEFLGALKISNVFVDKHNHLTFFVDKEKGRFSVRSKSQDKGDNTSFVDATLEGESIEISFNHRYVIDAFQAILSDSIQIQIAGPGRPMLMKGVSDPSFIYIVMPMNK